MNKELRVKKKVLINKTISELEHRYELVIRPIIIDYYGICLAIYAFLVQVFEFSIFIF